MLHRSFVYLALLLSVPFAGLAVPCFLVSVSEGFDACKHLGYASGDNPEYVAAQYGAMRHAVGGMVLSVAGLWAFGTLFLYAKHRSLSLWVLAALSAYVVIGVSTPYFVRSAHWGLMGVNPESFLFGQFPILIAIVAGIALLSWFWAKTSRLYHR